MNQSNIENRPITLFCRLDIGKDRSEDKQYESINGGKTSQNI